MDSKLVAAHAETATLTAQRIMDYQPTLAVTSNVTGTWWYVKVHDGRQNVEVHGDIDSVKFFVDAKCIETVPASGLTRRFLARRLCQLTLDRNSIPPLSRANVEAAIAQAEDDVHTEFALGMRRLIRNGFPAVWTDEEHDDAERWMSIADAAYSEKGEHIGFLLPEQGASVPLDIIDIYSSRYYEVANEVMTQFNYDLFEKAH